MKALHSITFILMVIGGLNWLLTAFKWNVVEMIFGMGSISMIIYILVGLSTLYQIFTHKDYCKFCAKGNMPAAM